jgi:beta-glucosidase
MKHLFSLLIFIITISCGILQAQNSKIPVYKDSSASVETRIKDLLGQMTLEEKCRQVDIWHPRNLKASDNKILQACLDSLGDYVNQGIGFLQFITQNEHEEYAENFNAIQKYFVEKTRLGIPAISNGEGCHGFMGHEGTVFPTPMSMGSTWDTELVEEIYTAIGKEMRLYGITHAATPVIDLLREPRYGRSEEMFGEDPYLVGEMAVSAVFGLQGRDKMIITDRLIACAKHFGASSEPEGGTNIAPVNISERVLRETHFYPFEQVVKRANIRTVMASYNEIDGVPSHGNSWLLNNILRCEWGFTGYVISDFDGVGRMEYDQHIVPDQAGAAKRALESGMDFECPQNREKYCFKHLPALIKSGQIKESSLDSAVARVLRTKFEMGLFEQPYVLQLSVENRRVYHEKHRLLALKAAEEGMVLLKNENNLLPFNPDEIKHLAVIGPNADEVHYGNYSNVATPGISILEGLQKFGKGKFEVHYAEGIKIYENDNTIAASDKTPEAEEQRIREAVELASRCDAVLLIMGESELTCREGWGEDRTGDRVGLDLLGRQNDLAKAIFATGKKTAVLLINGRPLAVNYLAENAPAIIEGWYLGQEQGTAVANVIFGKVNPSGKLTATFPRSVGHLPVYYNHKPILHERSFVEGPYSPLFPFGLGLSYTKFKYSNLKFISKKVAVGEPVIVSVDVTNTGDRDGVEVVQLYIHDKVSSVTRAVKELKDFKRISLAKGETKTVKFTITSDKLQFYNLDMKRVVEPGEFEVMVGGNSVETLNEIFEVF